LARAPMLVLVLFSILLLQGGSCSDDGETRPRPDFCEVEVTGPLEMEVGEIKTFEVALGATWVEGPVTWSATGPGNATIRPETVGDPLGHEVRVSFDATGTYTLTATASGDEDPICEDTATSVTVIVVSREEACACEVAGPASVEVGQVVEYTGIVGVSFYDDGIDRWSASWSALGDPTGWALSGGASVSGRQVSQSYAFSKPGIYVLLLDVTDSPTGEEPCDPARCELEVIVTDPNQVSVPEGRIDLGVEKPDGGRMFEGAGSIQRDVARIDDPYVFLFACDRGYEAIDLVTRQPVDEVRLVGSEADGVNRLGVGLISWPERTERPLSLLLYGGNSLSSLDWIAAEDRWSTRTQSLDFGQTYIGAVPFTDGSPGAILVDAAGSVSEVRPNQGQTGWTDSFRFVPNALTGDGEDRTVAAVGTSSEGPVLAAVAGSPGAVWLWYDAGQGFEGTEIGSVGDDPRLMVWRNGIAVVTNFASDSITVLTWDGQGDAAITTTQGVGDGPVGVDLAPRVGGGVYALTTGFNDSSYSITEIDASGQVVRSTTEMLPVDLTQPAHGTWIGDADDSFVVSCFGSDALFVGRR